MTCELIYRGMTIRYELERKSVKNMNLRVCSDGSVHLSVNRRVSEQDVRRFVQSKAEWIIAAIQKYQQQTFVIGSEQYVEGSEIFYFGKPYLLHMISGRDGVCLEEDQMIISCRNADENTGKRLYLRWYDQQCRIVFNESLDRIFPRFSEYKILKPQLVFRYMTSRWGSCMVQRNTVTLNKHLLKVPAVCLDFVVAHELTHLIHPNHSKRYYDTLLHVMPDAQERKEQLNQYRIIKKSV